MEMEKIKILHLSDLHLIGSANSHNLMNAICDFAKKNFREIPQGQKLLVLTGDFHNFNDSEPDVYKPAKEFLGELCTSMDIDSHEDVFMVPGNHDIDADSTKDGFRQFIIDSFRENPDKRSLLNQEGTTCTQYMRNLLSHYKAYLSFVQEMGIYSKKDCDNQVPVGVHVQTWRGCLYLLHLNTTLVADGKTKTNQMTDTLSATSSGLWKGFRNDLPRIALGHNNLYDMDETQRNKGLRGAFGFGNISAYLCGDRHQTDDEGRDQWFELNKKKRIPNICAPRGSCDEKDTSSQFGLIVHEWSPYKGTATWIPYLWNPTHPNDDLTPLKKCPYKITQMPKSVKPIISAKPKVPEATETLRQQMARWELGNAAEFLDGETVAAAARQCGERDVSNFYRVNDDYGVMLRTLAAGKGIPRDKAEEQIKSLLEKGSVLITGNGGMGKTTLMLMSAIRWVKSDGVAVWLNLSQLDGGKAHTCMESLSKWAEEGQRVLLCLDSPMWGREALQKLRSAWTDYGLSKEKKGCVRLLMAERGVRLKNLAHPDKNCLCGWFDGASVAELRRSEDTRPPFELGAYPTEIITEEDFFRAELLDKMIPFDSTEQTGQFRKILEAEAYQNPYISIVELIYRTRFQFQVQDVRRPPNVLLDWQEWGNILRTHFSRQLSESVSDFELYGGIAALHLFHYSMPVSLFCRRFGLDERDFTNFLREQYLSSSSGNIEPVIYNASSHVSQRKGDWGTLKPKHNIIAELFFLFRKERENGYDENSVDHLILEHLDIMSGSEIAELFRTMIDRDTMRQLSDLGIGRVNYREYMKLVCVRTQENGEDKLELSEDSRIHLCLGLLWSDNGKRISKWDEEIHAMLEYAAPEADGDQQTNILYTEWGVWLTESGKDKEAEKKLRKVVRKSLTDVPSRAALGKLLARRVNDKDALEEAEYLFKKGIELDPDNVHCRTEWGILLRKRGDKQATMQAEVLFREAISKAPESMTTIPPRHELGRLLERAAHRTGDISKLREAKKLYLEILDINSKHPGARDGLERLKDVEL